MYMYGGVVVVVGGVCVCVCKGLILWYVTVRVLCYIVCVFTGLMLSSVCPGWMVCLFGGSMHVFTGLILCSVCV